MALSLVQENGGSGASSTTQTPALLAAPSVGNQLVCVLYCKGTATISTPIGWVNVTDTTGATAEGYVFSRVVQSGDGTSYSFTLGTAEVTGWHIAEWTGQNNVVQQASVTRRTSATTTFTSPSITPSNSNGQAVALMMFASGTATASIASGWTAGSVAYNSSGNAVGVYSAYDNSATVAGTAVSMTSTLSASATGVSVGYIIYPANVVLSVQNVSANSGSSGSASPAFTLGATPTPGNVIVSELKWKLVGSTFSVPSGWNSIDNLSAVTTDYVGVATLWREVQSGDTATFTWTSALSSSSALWEVQARELNGANVSSPIAEHSCAQGNSSTMQPPSETPPQSGCFVMASAAEWEVGPPSTPTGFVSASSGDTSANDLYYRDVYISQAATSALSPSFGEASAGAWAADLIIIAPASGNTETQTANASGVIASSQTATASGIVLATASQTASASGIIKATTSTTSRASGIIASVITAGASGLVKAIASAVANAAGIVLASTTKTTTASAIVKATASLTAAASGIVQATTSKTVAASGIVASIVTASASAIVRAVTTDTANASGIVLATTSKTANASGIVKETQSIAVGASGIIREIVTTTTPASAIVRALVSMTATATAVVASYATAPASAIVEATATKTANASAIVITEDTGYAFANAGGIVQAQSIKSADASAIVRSSFIATASGIIRVSQVRTANASSIVVATSALSANASAIVRETDTKTAAASAIVKATASYSAPASAVVQVTGQMTANASAAVYVPPIEVISLTLPVSPLQRLELPIEPEVSLTLIIASSVPLNLPIRDG